MDDTKTERRTIRRPISKMLDGLTEAIPTCQGAAVVSLEKRKGRLLLKIEYPAKLDDGTANAVISH